MPPIGDQAWERMACWASTSSSTDCRKYGWVPAVPGTGRDPLAVLALAPDGTATPPAADFPSPTALAWPGAARPWAGACPSRRPDGGCAEVAQPRAGHPGRAGGGEVGAVAVDGRSCRARALPAGEWG